MVLLSAMLAAPPAGSLPQQSPPISFTVAPSCAQVGVSTRLVIVGAGWYDRDVTIRVNADGKITTIGPVRPRNSPVRPEAGRGFSVITSATAVKQLLVTATDGELTREAQVLLRSTCPQVAVKPTCLAGPGTVEVTGSGFVPGKVPIQVDPFGNAETPPQDATADRAGNFRAPVVVPFKGGPVPIVVTRFGPPTTGVVVSGLLVVFVDPCSPPVTTTTSTTRRSTPDTTAPLGVTTTSSVPTGTPPPPGTPPPGEPPVTVGPTARVSISPRTVRPGRCVVIVVSAAPAALPVTARFADGPLVNGVTGPGGGTVLSVCQSHDSGAALGPVKVLIGVGSLAPVPAFTVLRVPPRPQPPLLQSGADGRRS